MSSNLTSGLNSLAYAPNLFSAMPMAPAAVQDYAQAFSALPSLVVAAQGSAMPVVQYVEPSKPQLKFSQESSFKSKPTLAEKARPFFQAVRTGFLMPAYLMMGAIPTGKGGGSGFTDQLDKIGTANAQMKLARLDEKNDPERALLEYSIAAKLYSGAEASLRASEAYYAMGLIHFNRSSFAEAEQHFSNAINAAFKAKKEDMFQIDDDAASLLHSIVGNSYYGIALIKLKVRSESRSPEENLRDAGDFFAKASLEFSHLRENKSWLNTAIMAAEIKCSLGDPKARVYYEGAVRTTETLNMPLQAAYLRLRLVQHLLAGGDTDAAIRTLDIAQTRLNEMRRSFSNQRSSALDQNMKLIMEVGYILGSSAKKVNFFHPDFALDASSKIDPLISEAETKFAVGFVHDVEGKYELAAAMAEKEYKHTEALTYRLRIAHILLQACQVDKAAKKISDAVANYRRAAQVAMVRNANKVRSEFMTASNRIAEVAVFVGSETYEFGVLPAAKFEGSAYTGLSPRHIRDVLLANSPHFRTREPAVQGGLLRSVSQRLAETFPDPKSRDLFRDPKVIEKAYNSVVGAK